nr:hypothetical protein DVH24_041225 [Ipomoea batatas]GMC87222.1 hypothetical protein DVH24_041225 [Ipomoea batatas]GMD00387.1 hypothetical protein DVH24_041225 [Ipomoea batatas]GMD29134.1 hypothetical protein DVH24_041225 [Ipomoea batatas]GMD84660.1 hypothetical protein DVH24_041225 [Ipomoea batatas]
MRAVQYIHAHVLEGIVAGEAAWRGGVGQQVEELEGSAGSVELVAGMGGEIEAEVLVAVENRGIDGAVEEREDGVGGRRDDGGLELPDGVKKKRSVEEQLSICRYWGAPQPSSMPKGYFMRMLLQKLRHVIAAAFCNTALGVIITTRAKTKKVVGTTTCDGNILLRTNNIAIVVLLQLANLTRLQING